MLLACDSAPEANAPEAAASDKRSQTQHTDLAPNSATMPQDAEQEPAEEEAPRDASPKSGQDEKARRLEEKTARDNEDSNTPKGKLPANRKSASGGVAGGVGTSLEGQVDELASFESELIRIEGQMRRAGVPMPSVAALAAAGTPTASSGPAPVTSDHPLDCKKACELGDAICSLADNICEMKKRHSEDERYVRACARGTMDCELGKAACEACSAA